MAEQLMTTLPSVNQESNHSANSLISKDKRTESKVYVEQSLIWEVTGDSEFIEPEVMDTKITGRRKVTLPVASTPKAARTLRPDRYSYNKFNTEDVKLPKQGINRSGLLKSSLGPPNRNFATQLSGNEQTPMAMPSVASLRQRSFTESCLLAAPETSKNTAEGKSFRENLSFIYRQNKEMKKLEYDNLASRQALKDAQDLISDLKAKIDKRNKYIKERNMKEGDLARDVESLRRERDEKLLEYKSIMKTMNQALAAKDSLLEETEVEKKRMESVYQEHLRENTELMRKIEIRAKQITQLKEKTEKAMKWKTNVRT